MEEEKPEGFWRELFLLRPDPPRLRELLDQTDPDFLLHVQHRPQQLLLHALDVLKAGQAPADENALEVSQASPSLSRSVHGGGGGLKK